PVPLAVRPIPAYTKITREDLIDPKTGEPMLIYLTPEQVERRGVLTSFDQLIGRVLNRDKQVGYGFTDKDFFPDGTRPGVVAGIPPGKRAFVFEVKGDKIHGLHNLKTGDRFDLLGTLPIDDKTQGKNKQAPGPDGLPKRAGVKVLVQNGSIVVPLGTREV